MYKMIFIVAILFVAVAMTAQPQTNATFRLIHVDSATLHLSRINTINHKVVFNKSKYIHGNDIVLFQISENESIGAFSLQVEYCSNSDTTLQHSEILLYLNKKDISITFNPAYTEIKDSIRFEKGGEENLIMNHFLGKSQEKLNDLNALQLLLANYTKTTSAFYKESLGQYENERLEYNRWVDEETAKFPDALVSSVLKLTKIPLTDWGNDEIQKESFIKHYFDEVDLNDSRLVYMPQFAEWITNYVNLCGQFAFDKYSRDSILLSAARFAIEKAKKSNQNVYGWMVDYFYNGFTINNIESGIDMLTNYLNDTACLTSFRKELYDRLRSQQLLSAGKQAPNFTIVDYTGRIFELHNSITNKKFQLIVFWSAGCSHCVETIDKIESLMSDTTFSNKVEVIGISIDEEPDDIKQWNIKKTELQNWTHIHAENGINSQVARNYFLLSIPEMFLIDSQSKIIVESNIEFNTLKNYLNI